MDKLQKIIKVYNDRQDEHRVMSLNPNINTNRIGVEIGNTNQYDNIGLYEWLFNPKYKVFEVFGIDSLDTIHHEYIWLNKSEKEIIDYIYKGLK